MRLIHLMVASLALLAFTQAFADDGPVVQVPVSADTVNAADLLKEVTTLRAAVGKAKTTNDRHVLFVAIAGAIAVVLKLIVSGLKSIPNDELTDRAKAIIPIALCVAGAGAGVLAYYAGGQDWIDSVVLGASAPGAIIAHQAWDALLKLVKKPKPPVSGGSALAPEPAPPKVA